MDDKALNFSVMDDGGLYLPTGERVSWFRGVHPNGTIATEILQFSAGEMKEDGSVKRGYAVAKAVVKDANGVVLGTGTKIEYSDDPESAYSKDFISTAETLAIGRALAFAGFGTRDALNGDPKLADAPVKSSPARVKSSSDSSTASGGSTESPTSTEKTGESSGPAPDRAVRTEVYEGTATIKTKPTDETKKPNNAPAPRPLSRAVAILPDNREFQLVCWGELAKELKAKQPGQEVQITGNFENDKFILVNSIR